MFPIILTASLVLYSSLDQELRSVKIRDQHLIRNGTFEVVDNLGFELFTLYASFSGDLYSRKPNTPIGLSDIQQAFARYKAHTRFPKLLAQLCCLVEDSSGRQVFMALSGDRWTPQPRPLWILDQDLRAGTSEAGTGSPLVPNPAVQTSFSLAHPVLSSYFTKQTGPQGLKAVFLLFDVDTVTSTIVPSLVKQSFSEDGNTRHYQVQILHKDALMPSLGEFSDLLVPLIPWAPLSSWFDHYVSRLNTLNSAQIAPDVREARNHPAWWSTSTDRKVLPDEPGWFLSVTELPEGIEKNTEKAAWKNAGISTAFFLILSAGFLGLYLSFLRSRRLAELELNFTRLVSHELKTPVAIIRSLAENLTDGIGTDAERAKEYGKVIGEESLRLSRMVQNILSLMNLKDTSLKFVLESFDLGELARELVEWFRKNSTAQGISIVLKVQEGLPPVQGQRMAISAVIDNLLTNAFKHGVSESGRAEVEIEVGRRRRGGRDGLEFKVTDHGPGIPASERGKIFQAFYRGDEADRQQRSGSGIGLNLTKLAVESFGGKVSVTSAPGAGTTVTFWLKAAKS